MSDGRRRAWDVRKRRCSSSADLADHQAVEDDGGIELANFRELNTTLEAERADLFAPIDNSSVYNMQKAGEKERLANDLWTGNFLNEVVLLRAANPKIVALLEAQISNTREMSTGKQRLIDGILLDMCRAQNQHMVPALTAAISLFAQSHAMHRTVHEALSTFHRGALCSETWVHDFLHGGHRGWPGALSMRPAPAWETLKGVFVCCFDNLQVKIDYKSYASEGEVGRTLDMTTWFGTPIPRHLAPALDAEATCTLSTTALLPHT